MKERRSAAVHLSDYCPPAHLVDHVDLTFRLAPSATRVISRIAFRPNPAAAPAPLWLDGAGPRLIRAAIDGREVAPETGPDGLRVDAPARPFLWEAEVEIDPAANTALEGLYLSNGMFCTQCEAEGFRRITFYPDRPDVLAPFRVRIEGDLPVMLSNGNPVASGPGRAEWDDPWPKPAYLFALVAGDLRAVRDRFVTRSGREVALAVWVRPGDEGRCAWALDALKRAMRWDEEEWGREYDLDVFNIVAVDDFNMGAMENKGLNIFNAKYILASPETATDADFARIESVIAHEYFHNWTGNRVTLRDWFQLCLKEGLTVYRDQEFTARERSPAVKRIEDVITLRSSQFAEDAGPLAHPVRPDSYVEINNFYTATVYEKGAELVRMLRALVGEEAWRAGCETFFARHDGQAVTVEDWLACFADAAGRDLSDFARWYAQAGTPRLTVRERFEGGTYTLEMAQETPPTPGQADKAPLPVAVAIGLIGADGSELMATRVVELSGPAKRLEFEGLSTPPVASLPRGFSAPVIVDRPLSAEARAFLLAHDTDPFGKWQAGDALARDILASMAAAGGAPGPAYLDALRVLVNDDRLDPAFRALCLRLPGESEMARELHARGHVPEPMDIHAARERLMAAIAAHLADDLPRLIEGMACPGPYSPEPRAAGRRALRLAALGLLARVDGGRAAQALFAAADNMTEQIGALDCLLAVGAGGEALSAFHRQWAHDRLVVDKWFALQLARAAPERAASLAGELTHHPAFTWRNPNRFRAVFGGLAGNHAGFHHPSGAGYDLLAGWLIRLDPVNPQTAARMVTAFETWPLYDSDRQARMRAALTRIRDHPDLSRDMDEMTARILGTGN